MSRNRVTALWLVGGAALGLAFGYVCTRAPAPKPAAAPPREAELVYTGERLTKLRAELAPRHWGRPELAELFDPANPAPEAVVVRWSAGRPSVWATKVGAWPPLAKLVAAYTDPDDHDVALLREATADR